MKPHPPSSLLGPGQEWIATSAQGWLVTMSGDCNVREMGRDGDFCRRAAVIMFVHAAAIAHVELLCDRHMGTHRWIQEDQVMQWRANPPWNYKPVYKPRKKVDRA